MAGGRPRKFKRAMLEAVLLSAADGATREAIASACGICPDTVDDWCDPESPRYEPAFSRAVTRARNKADDAMVSSLFKSGQGYEYKEQAVTAQGDVVWVKRYAKGETGAQKLWLTNRRRAEWADRRTVETDDPLEDLLAMMMRGEADAESPAVPEADGVPAAE